MDDEIYVIVKNRAKSFALAFLDEFLPDRENCSVEFPVPRFSDNPTAVYEDELQLLDYLELTERASYGIIWGNLRKNTEISHAILYYTEDACMILGIAVSVDGIGKNGLAKYFRQLAEFSGAEYGYVMGEGPPLDTYAEFISASKRPDIDRLYKGKVMVIGHEGAE